MDDRPATAHNSMLQKYYASLESRIGYRLFLGGTRHYGFYPSASSFPLPIGPALRAMEHELFKALKCPRDSIVLDAGCGVGHVAIYMAKQGRYKVQCIDIVERHVARARKNIVHAGMQGSITAQVGDYHHLEKFQSSSFDGIYTMETLVHSTNPLQVLKEFHRLLKPGGRIAMNEYDHMELDKSPRDLADIMSKVNKYAAMPANASFDYDVLKDLLHQAGFEDVHLRDMSRNIVPILWLFWLVAVIPYLILSFLGIEHHFVNTVAGYAGYRGRSLWRYIQVTGRKKSA